MPSAICTEIYKLFEVAVVM